MSTNILKLRSRRMIALAYILGPFIGLNAWYATIVIPAMFRPDFSREGAATGWFVALLFGGFACIVVELFVVTPILLAFDRYRWPWLNGWSAASIGFSLGALPWFLLSASHPPSEPAGSVTTCTQGRCVVENWATADMKDHSPLIFGSHWTYSGWIGLVGDAAMMGMVGLIAAVVFRLVAVDTVRLPGDRTGGDCSDGEPQIDHRNKPMG